jgi:uncharacterized protein with HEPN domain
MRPDARDSAYLWDMREAARNVLSFVQSSSLEEVQSNLMMRFAVERGLEIIGEAARRVSSEFRVSHPEIPWSSIIGQRNVLAHEYGEVDWRLVWVVLEDGLPQLLEALDQLLPPAP